MPHATDRNPITNTKPSKEYGPEVQRLDKDTPLDDILWLLKRDGGVFIKGLVPEADVDKAHAECLPKLDADSDGWEGKFYPKETQRAYACIGISPTFTRTQLMNPTYQAICKHFLTTRSKFWLGPDLTDFTSDPYAHSCSAIRIGPGAKAQPLHRDDYVSHNFHTEIDRWEDDRDLNFRERSLALFISGGETTVENGGTNFIPGSHLWGTDRSTPPDTNLCIQATMSKGDAFIMLASSFHGGGENKTKDVKRLVWTTFMTRGWCRQEENQFLAVSQEVARKLPRDVQDTMGYKMSSPAGGWVEAIEPIYHLMPELKLKDMQLAQDY